MRIRRHSAVLIFCLLTALTSWAAPIAAAPHLTVQLVVPPAQIYPGQSFTAGIYFKLDKGWHVYWMNAGDSGLPPRVQWALPAGVTAGAMQYPTPQRLPLGPLMDYGYENEVLFPVPMQVASSFHPEKKKADLVAKIDWLVCREVCIPGKATVDVVRPALAARPAVPGLVGADQLLITRFEHTLPTPLPAKDKVEFLSTPKGFTLTVFMGRPEKSARFFPFDQNVIKNAAPQTARTLESGIELRLIKDDNLSTPPKELSGVLVLPGVGAFVIHARPGAAPVAIAPSAGFGGLSRIIGLAFLGGIILNLMPCVFPVLFIKALSLVQSSREERKKMRAHGWMYTLGILVSFWVVVALLLLLRAGGRQLGWGFQFQSPSFIAVMALVLFFLGLSLAGMFEIGLSLTSAGGGLAQKSGYTGSFFTGVLAMVVATPCTAPFMGAAIGYALSQSALVTFGVFTALGLGLAAPYLLLAFNPAWTRLLPRPGAWMEVLKQAISIPIFVTVIWLVWLFTQSAGANALVFLLLAFLLLAVAGWILGRWPAKFAATIAAVLVLAAAVAVPVVAAQKLTAAPVSVAATNEWQPFTPQLVGKYRAEGKPVFVDFTASWCLSCQVNERVVLDRADVQQALKQSGVELVRADWTRHDADIAQALAKLGRSGVPTYVLYSGDAAPQILPEVLTPGIVIGALDRLKPQTASETATEVR